MVGAYGANKAYVYYGCTSSFSSSSSSTCNDNNNVTLTGPVANSFFGYSVSANSDNTVVVGAPTVGGGDYHGVGAAYIYYGTVTNSSTT